MKPTTEQVSESPKNVPNPNGIGGFGDHPENRNPGGWNKEQSISYQYNMLMRLTPDKLAEFEPTTVAQKIALKRIQTAITEGGLNDTKEITDRTEGKAPQSIDLTSGGKTVVALVEFMTDGTEPDSSSNS